jgi:cytochrome c oxidase subunit II
MSRLDRSVKKGRGPHDQGRQAARPLQRHSRSRALKHGVALAGLALAMLVTGCAGDYPQTTFRPVTDFGREIHGLFTEIFWWTMAVLAVVEFGLLFIIIKFRDRPGAPEPKQIHGNNTLELLWTLIPAIIVAFIVVPTVRTIFQTYRNPPNGALIVEAIGHQWWWEFQFPQYGPNARTSNQLYLPVGRPIEIRTSSADVIHSFWVPRIGGKRDNFPVPALPDGAAPRERFHHIVFTLDQPGDYSGQCAEYCGLGHALMRMRIVAVPAAQFDAFLDKIQGKPAPSAGATAQPVAAGIAPVAAATAQADTAPAGPPGAPPAGTIQRQGFDIFTTHACVACHRIAGTPAVGRIGPDLTLLGDRWAIGAGTLPNTLQNVERWITDPGAVKEGAKMPGVKVPGGGIPPTGLTPDQVAAVAAYLESLK